MRYRYEADLWADIAYEQAMVEQVPFTCDASETMPIALYQAYGSYHYGIYALSTNAQKRANNINDALQKN